jgi:hypothetical protein
VDYDRGSADYDEQLALVSSREDDDDVMGSLKPMLWMANGRGAADRYCEKTFTRDYSHQFGDKLECIAKCSKDFDFLTGFLAKRQASVDRRKGGLTAHEDRRTGVA